VNAQGGLYGNALQTASYGGYGGVVKILLEKGAEAQGGHYGNALPAASQHGDAAINQRGQRHVSAGVGRVGTPGPGLVLQESSSFVTGASGSRVASEASYPQEENESCEAGAIDDHGKGIAKERKAQRKRKTPTSAEQPAQRGLHDRERISNSTILLIYWCGSCFTSETDIFVCVMVIGERGIKNRQDGVVPLADRQQCYNLTLR